MMSNLTQSTEIQSIGVDIAGALPTRRTLVALIFAGTIGPLIVGCGIEPELLSKIEQASFQQNQITASFDDESNSPSSTPKATAVFTPAFPDREDPFHINHDEVAETIQQTKTSDIHVVGFANMGSQQAILKIGDETKFVRVGDIIGEIEVIGITPPRVRLKNGNFVWNASMFTNHN